MWCKLIVTLTIFLLQISTRAQNLDLSGGLNYNSFQSSSYQNKPSPIGLGYSIYAAIDDIPVDTITKLRLTISLVNYRGDYYYHSPFAGGTYIIDAHLNKYTLGVGLAPFHFTILKKIKVDLGLQGNFLVDENTTGTELSGAPGATSTNLSLYNCDCEIHKSFTLGTTGRISGKINFYRNWSMVPQMIIYYSLTKEFKDLDIPNSRRISFLFGIEKQLNKN